MCHFNESQVLESVCLELIVLERTCLLNRMHYAKYRSGDFYRYFFLEEMASLGLRHGGVGEIDLHAGQQAAEDWIAHTPHDLSGDIQLLDISADETHTFRTRVIGAVRYHSHHGQWCLAVATI